MNNREATDMTDPETLAALLRERAMKLISDHSLSISKADLAALAHGKAAGLYEAAAEIGALGVRVSPERAPPENHVIVKGATSSQQDTYSNALPRSTLIAARLEALVLEYTDSGECQECGTEVCRGAKHDPDCVIGQVDAALRGSP